MKKEEVYNKIVEELMVAPDKLEKFLDAFGTMSSWFLFKNLESLQNDHNKLERKVNSHRRDIEDLEKANLKLQASIKQIRKELQDTKQARI
jgi:septal ring factor EnvC (AmiA/AmiB activator)